MRLLRVIRETRPESGGPVEGLLRSSEVLIRDGHEVEVVSLESPEEAASRNFPFPVVGVGRGIGKYGYNPRITRWVRENAGRFDAVVLHGIWNYSSVGAWRGLRKQSTPYFIFTHGMMDPWFRKFYPLKHIAKLAYWWLAEGRVLRDAQCVLFTTEEERRLARGEFYGHSYKECVVRYGVADPPGDANAQKHAFTNAFPKLGGKRFLLFLGRIHPKKGCDLLIRAFARIRKEESCDLELAIAGPGSEGLITQLKKLGHDLGVSDCIHWLGMLVGELKWGALRSAHAFVLPSHQENFGIAVAEAMACCTPVLISNRVNIWREIEGSKAGFVEPDTLDGTLRLLGRCGALSIDERLDMAQAARRAFLHYFEINAAVRDLARVLGFAGGEPNRDPPKNLRQLHVIRDTNPQSGGPVEALMRNSEVLVRDGHEIEIVSLESAEEAARYSSRFPVTALGAGIGRYGYNPRLVPWIRQNRRNFDVVVLHGLWNYSSLGSWRALRKTSTPYFIFAHGMMDPWFSDEYPLKHIAKQIFWTVAEGRVLRDAQAVLFTCEEERISAKNVFKGHPYQEKVVLLGTADPEGGSATQKSAFESAFPQLTDRRFLLFLSRIHPKKGCDLLIKAFADSALDLPDELDLVIAGPDQVGWMSELKLLALKLGIAARIHWLGMLVGDLKWGALRSADALVLPSHQENFGVVVAEAMACSTPTLISNKVNIWREIEASQAGLVEPDTLEGTCNLIRRFRALSASERNQMSVCARNGFLRYFDVEKTAREFARVIYSSML